jgi:multiple sugar transport system permease protein
MGCGLSCAGIVLHHCSVPGGEGCGRLSPEPKRFDVLKKMTRGFVKQRRYLPYLVPVGFLSILLVLLPLAGLLFMSFLKWNLTQSKVPTFAGISNYVRMFSDLQFWSSLGTTLLFTVESVVPQVVLGMGIAVLFNRPWRGMGLIRALFLTPMMIAPLFAGMIWRLMYSDDFGIIKYVIVLMGFDSAPVWLADPRFALHAVILVNVWEWTAFVVLFILAGLQTIPQSLYEAASLEGCGRVRMFWSITLPTLRPILLTVVLFRAIDSFKVFDIIFAMTSGGPGRSTEVMSYLVYQYGINFFELGYSSTLALMVLAMVTFMAWLLLRLREERV